MNDEEKSPGPPPLSGTALEEWTRTVEHVMRGVAHALNNRAAALSAVIELSRDPEGDDHAAIESILSGELRRVTEIASAVRTLAPPRIDSPEALVPQDVVAECLALIELHIEHRDRSVMIDASAAQPIRVQRWMFVRALIAIAVAATARASPNGTVRLAVVTEGDWAVARVAGVAALAGQMSPYVAELASAMGGEALKGEWGFRVPTLAALRRREGR